MKIIPNFLRVDKLIIRLFTPKHTVESVVRQLAAELESGSITLRQQTSGSEPQAKQH